MPPEIVAGKDAIQHARIATREYHGREPTRSKIKVAVNSRTGIESVRLSMRVRGIDVLLDMVEAKGFWRSAVGEFDRDMAGHDVELTVIAVGKNKLEAAQPIGRVHILDCDD
jgi:hypothetical protein